VLRLRRTREERVGAWVVCVGELLEDGVLRVGVSGTLVSMRIAPALLGSFKGPGATLSGSRVPSERAAATAPGFELRRMP